ncbi:hypothetical protein [Roseovarius Plymouth podovirus 1]|uniref:Uncharacterized protein n=2 Tax=Roseovarius Plymouth podovirus 1 TaxID=926474 RepID=K4Q566_9CAUD|nr:hypothetical protein HYO70_gp73 [Roseovarius Plymouth podovirus 1]CBW47067.1 hypothetical protein [Roseovarius sp. 217 phage 1]CBX88003.1 hypothetical protein [Roseovarius Plymouth podovirus 1]
MIGQREIIILVATLSLLGGAFAYGYHKGTVNQIEQFEEDRQELQNDLLDLNETLSVKNAEILRLNREKEGLINELENQALTAEGSSGPGIATTGGLQRLEQRWGPSPTSP